jgi:hypothetical protein
VTTAKFCFNELWRHRRAVLLRENGGGWLLPESPFIVLQRRVRETSSEVIGEINALLNYVVDPRYKTRYYYRKYHLTVGEVKDVAILGFDFVSKNCSQFGRSVESFGITAVSYL